jgi:DNA-binding MarR family transcriptional regulator
MSKTDKTNTNWFHLFSATLDKMLLEGLSSTDILVYLMIKQRADLSTGVAKSALNTMANKASMCERTVSRSIEILLLKNFISREQMGRSFKYRLIEYVPISGAEHLASWMYVPLRSKQAQNEIKTFEKTGNTGGERGQVQFVKNQLNINTLNVQININGVDEMEISDAKLRLQVEQLLEKARNK